MKSFRLGQLESEAEKKEKALMDKERGRLSHEKYSYHKLKLIWYTIPVLFLIIGGIFIYLTRNETQNSVFDFIYGLNFIAFMVAMHYDEKWKDVIKVKSKISTENSLYKFNTGYNDNIIHTDSQIEKILYLISKIIIYIEGVIGAGALSLITFSWFGSITIAPTTIIIILLVIIVINQEKSNL